MYIPPVWTGNLPVPDDFKPGTRIRKRIPSAYEQLQIGITNSGKWKCPRCGDSREGE